MCEKCEELRSKIEHCRRILLHQFDAITTQRMEALIGDYERQIVEMDCQKR